MTNPNFMIILILTQKLILFIFQSLVQWEKRETNAYYLTQDLFGFFKDWRKNLEGKKKKEGK
jgi:hypothetical protein